MTLCWVLRDEQIRQVRCVAELCAGEYVQNSKTREPYNLETGQAAWTRDEMGERAWDDMEETGSDRSCLCGVLSWSNTRSNAQGFYGNTLENHCTKVCSC